MVIMFSINIQVKFKTKVLRSSLCDYSKSYILVKGTITVVWAGATAQVRQGDRNNKQATFKVCAPFTDCITEINNTEVDNAKYLDVVMLRYNLMEYSDNYKDQWKNSINDSMKFKSRFLDNTKDDIINAQIAVSLNYLNNFWRMLEMILINCEINLISTWWSTCVTSEGSRATPFTITDTKHVQVVTLSTNDNVKLLEQLKSVFRRKINWHNFRDHTVRTGHANYHL